MININKAILVTVTAILAITFTTIAGTFGYLKHKLPSELADDNADKAMKLVSIIAAYFWWSLITLMT